MVTAMDDYAKRLDAQTIQFVRILPGPIEKIWDFLADGKKRGEWFASGDLPAEVGETFQLRFKHSELSPNKALPPGKFSELDKHGHVSRNILLAFEPPHRLVISFGPEERSYSEVEFRLEQEGNPKDNKVRLTLTHSKLPDRQYAVDVSGGWHSHLAILQLKAEGKVPPGFWDVWRQSDGIYDKHFD
jgi:uncharacterized protein YndB with AHSA1/START domain